MAGRADDESLFMLGANLRHLKGRGVEAEVDHGIALVDDGRETVSRVDLADDLEFRQARRAAKKCQAHAALGSGDDDFC